MKIAIRAEGGRSVGMGHVMRTLVLAKELSPNNKVCYICKYSLENEVGIAEIEKNEYEIYTFRENILEVLSKISVDLLITDSYDVDENYFAQTKKYVKYTVYIDDINSFDYPVDLIINQNINASDFNYHQKYKLLGLKYIMLRDEFRRLLSKNIHEKVENIMVTMGGSDPVEFTKILIDWIRDLHFNFHVIIGSSFKDRDYFKNIYFRNIKFYFNAKMSDVMQKCDLALSASGSSIYELISSGVPCMGIVIADNQLGISEKLESMNIIENLGWYCNLNRRGFENKLITLCNNYVLRKWRSIAGQEFIDGCGARRITDFLETKFKV